MPRQRTQIHYVPSTHWDREWYLPFQGFRYKLVKVIDRLIEILEADPDYSCFVFDGQTVALDDYLEEHMGDNRLPLLLFLAGQDRIVDNPGVLAALGDGAQGSLEVIDYPDQTHSVQFDAPERLVQDMDAWLSRQP